MQFELSVHGLVSVAAALLLALSGVLASSNNNTCPPAYYVNVTSEGGNDNRTTCTTPSSPCLSLSHVASILPSDNCDVVIYIGPGKFDGSNCSAVFHRSVSIVGIQGATNLSCTSNSTGLLTNSSIRISHLTMEGCHSCPPALRIKSTGSESETNLSVSLSHTVVADFSTSLDDYNSSGIVSVISNSVYTNLDISSCTFRNNSVNATSALNAIVFVSMSSGGLNADLTITSSYFNYNSTYSSLLLRACRDVLNVLFNLSS
jgi:hypothetical protein